jgi:hypothetical protein
MTTPLPDEREDRLPQWARTLIADLRQRNADLTKRAEEVRLATDPDATDTVLYGRRGAEAIGLPPGAEVFYRFGPDDEEDVISVQLVRSDPHRLVLHSPRRLLICPVISNSFAVFLDRT